MKTAIAFIALSIALSLAFAYAMDKEMQNDCETIQKITAQDRAHINPKECQP